MNAYSSPRDALLGSTLLEHPDHVLPAWPERPLDARALDRGMGEAVARRTVFRDTDGEDWGRVADRVAAGNIALLGRDVTGELATERARLRNAIATGALLTSGRHLQHGDEAQVGRNIEVFTNCATAITSFTKFYLLLNGSGVGRSYDDELMAVDWADAPDLLFRLAPEHPDFPQDAAAQARFETALGGGARRGAAAWPRSRARRGAGAQGRRQPRRLGARARAGGEHGVPARARAGGGARLLGHPPGRQPDRRHAGPAGLGPGVAAARLPEPA